MAKKRSKPDSRVKDAPASKKKKTVVSSDVSEEAFPRGGKSILSALEVRKIHQEVKQDLFATPTIVKTPERSQKLKEKRKKTKSKPEEEEEDNDDSFEGILKRLDREAPSVAESLNYNSLTEGATLIGAIKEIKALKLVITIAGSHDVVAPITEISDQLNERMAASDNMSDDSSESEDEDNEVNLNTMFTVGQIIRCVVIEDAKAKQRKGKTDDQVQHRRRIQVSLKPSLVNKDRGTKIEANTNIYGAVSAEEDYGYIIHFGTHKKTGFLKKSKCDGKEFQIGQPIESLVSGSYDSKKSVAVPLTLKDACMKISSQTELTVQSLYAGLLAKVKILKILSSGLVVRLLDFFNASIPLSSLDLTGKPLEDRYKKGETISARIIHLDYENKTITMSCKDHILQWEPVKLVSSVGDVIENATIVNCIKDFGLYLRIDVSSKCRQTAFVHISQVSDNKAKPDLQEKFPVGSVVPCRVTDINYADGILQVSMKKSVIELPFLQHSDLSPGTELRGSVLAIQDYGVLVKLSDKMKGLIPIQHLADVMIRTPAAKFKIDQKVKCRVLSVDPIEKRVVLTAKKTLLNSKSALITSYDTPPGTISHGVIQKVLENGCVVTFYNNVRAFAPQQEITDDQSSPLEVFNIGQPMQCRVINASAEKQKMLVSFRVSENTDAYESLTLGSTQSGKILATKAEYVEIQLDCGVRARLRKFHCSDVPSFCDNWMAYYGHNKTISNLFVLSKPEHRPVEVTRKLSLIQSNSRSELPSSIKEMSVGTVVYGFVKKISSIGIHIGFMGRVLGFVPKSQVADEFVEDPSKFFVLGQTVRAYVAEIDQQRLILSLKQSLCATDGIPWAKNCFEEEKALFRSLVKKNKKNKLSLINIGDVVTGTITENTDLGLVIKVDKTTSGLLLSVNAGAYKDLDVGSSITARVLDITQQRVDQRIIDLTAHGVENAKKVSKSLQLEKEYTVRIELVKAKYLVVSYKNFIGFVPVVDYNTMTFANPFASYEVGKEIRVTLAIDTMDSLYSRSLLFTVPMITRALGKEEKQEIVNLNEIPGMLVTGQVIKKVSHTMKIALGYHVVGRINATEVFDKVSEENPFSDYEEGDSVTAKVLSIKEVASNRHLPISHQNPVTHRRLELTLRPSKLKLSPPDVGTPVITWKNADQFLGKSIIVIVYEIRSKKRALGVYVSSEIMNGTIPVNFLPDNSDEFTSSLSDHYHLGQSLKARVSFVDMKYKSFCLSLCGEAREDPYKTRIQPGKRVMASIIKPVSGFGILVNVAPNVSGFVPITEIADEYKQKIEKKFSLPNHFFPMVILPALPDDKRMVLSCRKSRVFPEEVKGEEIQNPIFHSFDDLKEDQIVSGYCCENIKGNGVYVSLGRGIKAYVPHEELQDKFDDKTEIYYSRGRLVTGRVLSVDTNNEEHPIIMSLKKSRVSGVTQEEGKINIRNIEKGQKLKGYVRHIKDFGILIEIKHSNGLLGLCHRTQISDKDVKWKEIFELGDYVKVVVLNVDSAKKRLELGMKPSYFTDDDVEFDSDDEEEENENSVPQPDSLLVDDSDDSDDSADDVLQSMRKQSQVEEDSSEDEVMEDADEVSADSDDSDDAGPATKKQLGGAAFEWNDFDVGAQKKPTDDESSEESSDDEDDENNDSGTSKRARKLAKQREEEKIAQTEEEIMEGDKGPETIADYERLLLASPNDSFLWIKYMAFLLSMTEIEKARAVVERGLKRINLRKEDEKLNLWVAYMNLELMYGSPESLKKVVENAVLYNDPKLVYLRLVDIYANAEKLEEAEKVFQRLVKKYKRSKGIWIKYCTFKMTNGESEAAHKLFQRAIELLPQRKHIPLINKFAQLEYKIGDAERGRTMFEGIVSNYPKKTDIWSVYIDMEIKYIGDVEAIRRIFERATSLTLSSKKMKFLFTRYLNFEKEHGDENTVDHVKEKVVEFLEKSSNQ